MKPVKQKMADDCVKAFAQQFSSSKSRITTSVSFERQKLLEWLQKVPDSCSHIHVKFGAYTAEHAREKADIGRTTVFLCACDEHGEPSTSDDGHPLEPINHGDLLP